MVGNAHPHLYSADDLGSGRVLRRMKGESDVSGLKASLGYLFRYIHLILFILPSGNLT